MRGKNNLGRQYTDDPNFGKNYPNTQYKGYAEEEGQSYSQGNNMTPSRTGYGYTSQYQGNNPYHSEARLSNVQYHGGAPQGRTGGQNQYQPQSQYQPQYQVNTQAQPMNPPTNRSGMSQLQYNTGSQNQPVDRYQGLSQYQSGTVHAQDLSQYQSGASGVNNQYQQYGTQGMTQGGMSAGSHEQLEQSGQIKTSKFNDRDRINDLLASEKYLTEGYNISTFEATNPELHNTLTNILTDTHKNRESLHQLMEQRGWYQTQPADQQQVTQAFTKFNEYKNQLPF